MTSRISDKPKLELGEYRVTEMRRSYYKDREELFNIKEFKEDTRIVIAKYSHYEMEFDIIGIQPFLANTFRRLILSDVPTIAIEKVHIYNNTSVIQDEVLAHRLGLIPLKANPKLFEFHDASAEYSETDSLEFELKVRCTHNKDNKYGHRPEDLYKNHEVLSKQIKWVAQGNQLDYLKESDVGPIHDDILIAKMRPGHEIDCKLIAVKGIGRDHAKFSPVATVFYRLLPEIKLTRAVEGEAAERLQKCFSPGTITLETNKNNSKVAKVDNARYDMSSRNVYRYEDLKNSVILTKVPDHFIFTIESVGAVAPDVIFREAVTILKKKCLSLLEELNN